MTPQYVITYEIIQKWRNLLWGSLEYLLLVVMKFSAWNVWQQNFVLILLDFYQKNITNDQDLFKESLLARKRCPISPQNAKTRAKTQQNMPNSFKSKGFANYFFFIKIGLWDLAKTRSIRNITLNSTVFVKQYEIITKQFIVFASW